MTSGRGRSVVEWKRSVAVGSKRDPPGWIATTVGTDTTSNALAATPGSIHRAIRSSGVEGLGGDGTKSAADITIRTGGSTGTVSRVRKYADAMVEPPEHSW
jgi:hypothetical protein